MSIREARGLIAMVFYVSLFLSLIVMLPDLFSSDSLEVKLKKALLTSMLLTSPFVYTFRRSLRTRSRGARKAIGERKGQKVFRGNG
jgi:hypothetical protein